MANIAKLEFPALNITGDNYMPWTTHVKRHLQPMGVLKTMTEGNNCEEQDNAKADVFLHKHIDEMLQFEYSNYEDPYVLREDLKGRFDNQMEVLLPTAKDEWNNLRFQDFKKVNEYTYALFRICSTLRICGQTVTEEDMLNNLRFQDFKKVNEYTYALFRICSTLGICGQTVTEGDMLEKTFSTFHASNMNLQPQYRLLKFKRYYDLNSFLLVAEKNNKLLMKNYQSRPTGSLEIPEAKIVTNNDTKEE
ncbi:uncharacterized protein LOC143600358 [Bidens hawaiensis]|uniref:uncharacterized protein LOC143600358 n=1 Tax=Bidens hawaiensis TaxID=980011 RepID=UPI004049D4F7